MSAHVFPSLSFPWPKSVAYQATRQGWRFDPLSFALGFAVAFLLVALIYRYRAQIGQRWDQAKAKIDQVRQRLTANVTARYSVNAIETVQKMHLLEGIASLDQLYVETQLYAPLAREADELERPTLSPRQATQAHDRLVIVGPPGSGRTTLLGHILLLQAGRLHAAGEGERVPIYAYLPALLGQEEEADTLEGAPAERLVEAAIASLSGLAATGVARWLRGQVESGNALLLLDGWDEVSPEQSASLSAWIQKLLNAHPGNRLVLTARDRGYGPLVEDGFVPLQPVPWSRRQLTELARRLTEVWPDQESDPEDRPDQRPPVHVAQRLTPPTPWEATVELIIRLRGQMPARTPAERMAQLAEFLLPPPETDDEGQAAWPLQAGHRALGRLALAAMKRGRPMLGREQIQSTVTEEMPSARFAPDQELSKEKVKKARQESEARTLQVVDCCRALTADGAPIRAWGNRRYLFIHPLITAYWAARHLADAGAEGQAIILEHVEDADWRDVSRFYVGLAPAKPIITHLTSADDLLMSNLWTAADLARSAPSGQLIWRQELVKRLAQLLMNPRLPEFLRDRALTALINSGEQGVGLLFKRIAGHDDPLLRAGGMLGLGVLGREADVGLLEDGLVDEALAVRLAAIRALGLLSHAGSRPALELVVAAMVQAEDQVQRIAAQILAEHEGEGHEVLREGAQDPDIVIRRAAIYGLSAVGEPWAREILEEMHKDDEWLVRNAAIQALATADVGEDQAPPSLDLALPRPETEPWLINWAAERGEGTGVGEAAMATLLRALNEGDPPTRRMAAETLERLADPRTVDALRQRLRDPEPAIREAALNALDEISRRHDVVIPAK